jgi:ANTAR domain/PAS fold
MTLTDTVGTYGVGGGSDGFDPPASAWAGRRSERDATRQARGDASVAVEPGNVGWVRFYFAGERWEWSPQVARMHGYAPGAVRPTTALVLSHKHPDDRRAIEALLDEVRATRRAFSSRHRIIDTRGDVHEVVGTHGFYVDLSSTRQDFDDRVTVAVANIVEHREVIEQAKGMLMLTYHIDANRAFEVLRWRSQQSNIKIRMLAEQLIAEFPGQGDDGRLPERAVFDHVLLTAHERVPRR